MKKRLPTIAIRGAGDLATGVAIRLYRAGMRNIVMLETDKPLAVRRHVVFSETIYHQVAKVEEVTASYCTQPSEIKTAWGDDVIPVLCDPKAALLEQIKPDILIDAIIAKKNIGTNTSMAPFVIGLGPGFTAEKDVHAVVETKRGHYLGKVITNGSAIPNTGIPGAVNGYRKERVHWADEAGVFTTQQHIGTQITKNELIGYVNTQPITAAIDGVLRGLLPDGTPVRKGTKIADVDPRNNPKYCDEVSDKALAIGGGVLEAICAHLFSNE
ncbi:selenium-dependent molybdenum cofactor biosynthesis protein YqeB [Halodesulfovibrio marinisediminis]|uniref:Xanthine dehydrogenase accessory factor n=1 Tax=Halodesulfovibrio marinisediminis DSM 17456 TaxID=1121457 RepID=A0A1N6DUX6_9BACT|nr:selenium-dependent molybdenum cofactor biosynthesis protein YqeB [Halodesulfovibrio marinisediminis]SIN74579.1 xanthine dehydrogenase accessory factor [Halodesulfovibrio marinisediminis DSM 17456]